MIDPSPNSSIEFFDHQFERQVRAHDFALNPFEAGALPHLRGRLLDFGCGLGNLSVEAARRGCQVVAMDASEAAVARLREVAAGEALPIEVVRADLRHFAVDGDFDTVVSIGLLMFFDCATARRTLGDLKTHVRPGGTMIVNVLVEGTTYLDMFDPGGFCLFGRTELDQAFAGWELLASETRSFAAPDGRTKVFSTVTARKPALPSVAAQAPG